MKKVSWKEKCQILVNEYITLRDIKILRECGIYNASVLRDDIIAYCESHGIVYYHRKFPTVAYFGVLGLSYDYYYQKMLKEIELDNLIGSHEAFAHD